MRFDGYDTGGFYDELFEGPLRHVPAGLQTRIQLRATEDPPS